MPDPPQNGKKVRSVDAYLAVLAAGDKSPITIRNYRQVLKLYAEFLKVPLGELHKHLDPDDLQRYATSIMSRSKAGRKSTLSIISRYMKVNGVIFDDFESQVFKVKADEDRTDKPLDRETVIKMMDMGNAHSRAVISFLISTGCRAGETSNVLLSDVGTIKNSVFTPDIYGDVVNIRNDIAKRRRGGYVFLTSEAREFLTIWLKDRDRFIRDSNDRVSRLYTAHTGHAKVPRKDIGERVKPRKNDQRLFACSYSNIDKTFGRLYRAVDGSRGKYRAKITAHSCRAFFRTNAVKGVSIDLAEGILRHSGYLNDQYVRMTLDQKYQEFKAGEAALFLTRADHRIQGGQIDKANQKIAALEREMAALKAFKGAKEDPDLLIEYANWLKERKKGN